MKLLMLQLKFFFHQQHVKVKHGEPPNDIFSINYTAHGIINDIPPKFKSTPRKHVQVSLLKNFSKDN